MEKNKKQILEYKAMDLYSLSEKNKIFEYKGYTNVNNLSAYVNGFLLTKANRKLILNIFLQITSNIEITKKILDENTKYIVGLFSEKDGKKEIVSLSYGSTKDILEEFNKKITTSKKYEQYFSNGIKQINTGNIGKNKTKNDFSYKVENKNSENRKFKSLNDYQSIKNVESFLSDLKGNNFISTQDLIENEDKISEILNTLHNEIDKQNPSKSLLLKILEINYPFATKIKTIALKKLNEIKLKEQSLIGKNERFEKLSANT